MEDWLKSQICPSLIIIINQNQILHFFQVEEAVAVLQAHQAKENAANQAASNAMKKE